MLGEQALGVGQRVRGADTEDDRGEPEAVVQARQQRLARDRSEQPDAGRPVRQRHLGQVEQHVADVLAAEDDAEDHPHDDGHHGQEDVEPERAAEGVTGSARHHHHRRRAHEEQQQQRVGGQGRCGGQPDRPGPPGDRVQVTRQCPRGRGRSGHGASDPPSTTRHDGAAGDRDREQAEDAPGERRRDPAGLVGARLTGLRVGARARVAGRLNLRVGRLGVLARS